MTTEASRISLTVTSMLVPKVFTLALSPAIRVSLLIKARRRLPTPETPFRVSSPYRRGGATGGFGAAPGLDGRAEITDELGADLADRYWVTGLAPQALARLSDTPHAAWWDDAATPERESRDDIMRRAYGLIATSRLGR